jgi:putative oxidoreductase
MSKLCNCCEKWSPWLLSLLRVVTALLILQHGGQKVFGYPLSNIDKPALFSWPAGIGGILELVFGLLLLLGLFTRPAAFILFVKMAATYFVQYAHDAWWPIHNKGELAVIYCFVCLYLSAAGGGSLSVDHCLKRATPSL